jgi:hypothetical protein
VISPKGAARAYLVDKKVAQRISDSRKMGAAPLYRRCVDINIGAHVLELSKFIVWLSFLRRGSGYFLIPTGKSGLFAARTVSGAWGIMEHGN